MPQRHPHELIHEPSAERGAAIVRTYCAETDTGLNFLEAVVVEAIADLLAFARVHEISLPAIIDRARELEGGRLLYDDLRELDRADVLEAVLS